MNINLDLIAALHLSNQLFMFGPYESRACMGFCESVGLLTYPSCGIFYISYFRDGGVLLPALLRPKSRGYIRLRSTDPHEPPIIQPNYYIHPDDVGTMREGLKWSLKMTQTEAFTKNKISPIVDKFSCGNHVAFSDSYFECFLRHWSHTIYHSVGTCKMGPRTDPLTVVDAELRVHGVENLRVADASIMPAIVGANTNAPIIMIGEKAADMIIKTWTAKTSKESAKKDSKSKTEL